MNSKNLVEGVDIAYFFSVLFDFMILLFIIFETYIQNIWQAKEPHSRKLLQCGSKNMKVNLPLKHKKLN